jgi:hypothetical protein
VLASIYYDTDGKLALFQNLLHFGAMDILKERTTSRDKRLEVSAAFSSGAFKLGAEPVASISAALVLELTEVYFLGVNLIGWMIKFKHARGLELLLERGLDPTSCVDPSGGNNCLHFIAMHGTAEMVGLVTMKPGKRPLRLEETNHAGMTSGMLAARSGNIAVAQLLFGKKLRASARSAMERGCRAWVLAFARKQEKNEKSTQTGAIGVYDERYFNISPDPSYTIWYGVMS